MNVPDREIRENEQELLNRMWSEMAGQDGAPDPHGFNDLKERVHRKLRRRRIFRFSAVSGVAAILVAAVLFFQQPDIPATTGVYAQLEQMGVAVERPEVVLTAEDGMSMALDSMARFEQQTQGEVALHMASGAQKTLSAEQILKIEVPTGRQFHMILSDGSQVWLNAGSALEYPATFDKKTERRVRLTGEAFFEVQRNPQKPFYVEFGSNEAVRVIGTSFNVNAYTENGRHVTTLITGKISYDTGAGETLLEPNQQICMDCATGKTAVNKVDAAAYCTWKDGWLWFEAEKLPSLTARLGRIYGIKIAVDSHLLDYSFSGKIRQERGLDYILNLVTETTPITCEVTDGVIYLK